MKLGLKIDVATYRGAREALPKLLEILERHRARATFFLALGPDRRLAPGLPGREIGARCAPLFRGLRDAGHEVAIQAYDPVRWSRGIAQADAAWTARALDEACAAYLRLFGTPPHAHAATDWQMNRHAWRLTQRLGFRYGSDTRGRCPFMPVRHAEVIACPQLPTTLPTLAEIAADLGAADDAASQLRRLVAQAHTPSQVFTLRVGREDMAHAPLFEQLLQESRARGYALCALENLLDDLNLARLPRHAIIEENMPGSQRCVAMQGEEFLAAA
jgi:peptidoglycan/xylan/chitin deacetylase (PgdA/CDA1 family)